MHKRLPLYGLLIAIFLSGCSSTDAPSRPRLPPDMTQSTHRPWHELDERTLRENIVRLLPGSVRDKQGWATDLQTAYASLKIPPAPGTYCASIAIIEQESSFQANPVVPGLAGIVQRELEQRAAQYGIPARLLNTALLKSSPDGRSYRERIEALKTEKQLNELFQEMISELPFGPRWLSGYNPVRTAGPMQVSIRFAEQHATEKNYPYPLGKSLRDEVFTRRGGTYFGVAILLDYPAPYDEIVYRFADFNAGRYASRNAAFQSALGRLAGKTLSLDGDLLRYERDKASESSSESETALRALAGKLQMTPADIRRDLLREKTAAFADADVYKRLFQLAEQAAGQKLARQTMPRIDLKSPKITRQLTTEWFARRVEERYRHCLARGSGSGTLAQAGRAAGLP